MAASTLSVGFAKRVATHGYSATFAHTTIVIAKSGDIAYELATFRVTVNDESGKPVAYSAKHLLTWEKRGGLCKVVAQSINPRRKVLVLALHSCAHLPGCLCQMVCLSLSRVESAPLLIAGKVRG
jgi:hypothetical protein